MDQVRALARPLAQQAHARRQAELEAVVARQAQAAGEHLFQALAVQRGLTGPLARTDELHAVAAADEAVDHAPQGHGHAIDLGRPGLGHQGDAQTRRAAEVFGGVVERSHGPAD